MTKLIKKLKWLKIWLFSRKGVRGYDAFVRVS